MVVYDRRMRPLIFLLIPLLAACGETPGRGSADLSRLDLVPTTKHDGPRPDGPPRADGGPVDGPVDPRDQGSADQAPSPDSNGAPLGSWQNPIPITALPFTHAANTTQAPAQSANSYSPCAPSTNEGGGEFVYRLELATAQTVRIAVDDKSGDAIDVDVNLMTAADPTTCTDRNNVAVEKALAAGTHYIAVDTWVDASGAVKAGPYVLTVSATTTPPPPTGCLKNPLPSCQNGSAPLVNGVPTEAAGTGGCPAGMVKVSTFCIDRYEAMLVEVKAGNQLAAWSPYKNPGTTNVRALSVAGVVPQGYITQVQAAAACASAGKRLCTDSEWLRACQGPQQTTYPYGNTRIDGVCNDARSCHPVPQYFETSASWIWSELGNSCINQLPAGLDKTGGHAGCQTAEGLYDMMGNLHEWTADPAGTFRGGFYVDTKINGNGCLYKTTAHNVSHWDYSTGFRCCF